MDKKSERLAKLKKLSNKIIKSSEENYKEVIAENKRMQLPDNFYKKKEWAEKKLNKERLKDQYQSEGKDFERESYLEMQADESEKWERKQKDKKIVYDGSTNYGDATIQQYNKYTQKIKIDIEDYERKKNELGEVFYPNKETDVYNVHKDSKEKIDNLVEDLNKRVEKRIKFSRRRKFDDDADIDYINERNMRFNKNLERFYGQYTNEIKQNLERGTAV